MEFGFCTGGGEQRRRVRWAGKCPRRRSPSRRAEATVIRCAGVTPPVKEEGEELEAGSQGREGIENILSESSDGLKPAGKAL